MSGISLNQPEFLKPRYWPAWVAILLMRIVCLLPLRARWAFGSLLGYLAYHLAANRRHIVRTNIALCFPELTPAEQHQLVKENFRSTGISLTETAMAWFVPARKYSHLVDIEGLHHLKAAAGSGKGVILLGMHLSTLDFTGAVLGLHQPFDVMYRRSKNRLMDAVMTRGREKNFTSAIERRNVRGVVRRLRQGAVVWYGPDQDYGRKHSIFATFFGQKAATITATSRIAKMTGAPLILFSHYRDLKSCRYRIMLSEPLDDYPVGDETENCNRINGLIENAVRLHPEQYWWLHRRFKTRPEGEVRPYDIAQS